MSESEEISDGEAGLDSSGIPIASESRGKVGWDLSKDPFEEIYQDVQAQISKEEESVRKSDIENLPIKSQEDLESLPREDLVAHALQLQSLIIDERTRAVTAERGIKLEEAKRKEAEETAKTDPLTGLLNKRGFTEQVEQALTENRRFSVIIIDLIGFGKEINNTYGLPVGDNALKHFARIIEGCYRKERGDEGARQGGDEFAIIVKGGSKVAQIVANRVIRTTKMVQDKIREVDPDNPMLLAKPRYGLSKARREDTIDSLLLRADPKTGKYKGRLE